MSKFRNPYILVCSKKTVFIPVEVHTTIHVSSFKILRNFVLTLPFKTLRSFFLLKISCSRKVDWWFEFKLNNYNVRFLFQKYQEYNQRRKWVGRLKTFWESHYSPQRYLGSQRPRFYLFPEIQFPTRDSGNHQFLLSLFSSAQTCHILNTNEVDII